MTNRPNGANAASRAPKIQKIREQGFGLLYLNNRGYGGSGGIATEVLAIVPKQQNFVTPK
jgi:hypothetical protein